jgi:anti-anti-sigma factor
MRITKHDAATVVHMAESYSAFEEALLADTQQAILQVLDEGGPKALILDFSETEYFSSVFFEVLFRAWKRSQEMQTRFILCALTESCREILDTAKLDTLWDIEMDVDSSLRSVNAA